MSDDRAAPPRAALEALSDAVLAVASEQRVEPILQRLVDAARELVGARYAALGLPDDEGGDGEGFAEFLVSGLTDAEIEAIGPLPHTHGMLGAVLQSRESLRTPDLTADPRASGWWPRHHPDMRSLLGVPIVSKGTVIGALYLTNKLEADAFTQADQALIERFAAHAAVVIENARLHESSRELSVTGERNRLARDLHDSVTQTLFSLSLTASAAADLAGRDPERARAEVAKVASLAQDVLGEMRDIVFELRPPALEAEGLVATLRKHAGIVERVWGVSVAIDADAEVSLGPRVERESYRIVQEALNNAVKHARASVISVRIGVREGTLRVVVADDGVGFDPGALPVRARHLGLTSMEERARSMGGKVLVESAPGRGTTVTLEVPR